MTPVGPTAGFDCLGPAWTGWAANPATTPRSSAIIRLAVRRNPLAERCRMGCRHGTAWKPGRSNLKGINESLVLMPRIVPDRQTRAQESLSNRIVTIAHQSTHGASYRTHSPSPRSQTCPLQDSTTIAQLRQFVGLRRGKVLATLAGMFVLSSLPVRNPNSKLDEEKSFAFKDERSSF